MNIRDSEHRHYCGIDLPDTELTARLAESRCVWCGGNLFAADDMFCREVHETAWRQAKFADFNSGGTPVDRAGIWQHDQTEPPPSWLGQPLDTSRRNEPVAVTQADLNAMPEPEPTPVPDLQLGHIPDRPNPRTYEASEATADDAAMISHLFGVPVGVTTGLHTEGVIADVARAETVGGLHLLIGADLPPELDYEPPPGEPLHLGYRVREAVNGRPGIVATAANARTTGQGFAIDPIPRCYDAAHVLEEIDPEPEPRTAWPIAKMRACDRDGWEPAIHLNRAVADPGRPALPAERECTRCGHHTVPVPITAQFPTAHREADLTERGIHTLGWVLWPQRMTKLCCGHCKLPYPGATLVPMRRTDPRWGMVEYAVISTRGYASKAVTDETLARTPPGVVGEMVWGELYPRVSEGGTVWGCCHPGGCEGRAAHWVLLASALSWDGWLWQPNDGLPLRMGLCPHHWYALQREVYTSPDTYMRTGRWVDGSSHDRQHLVFG